jgi:hypothetical protein
MLTKKLTSPNRKIHGELVEVGKFRFGPAYFELRIAPYDFSGRWFGNRFLWSPQSRYLAVMETLTIDYADGPHTELLLIDFLLEKECPLSKVPKGFMVPIRFETPLIIYTKEFRGRGFEREFEIDFVKLDRWRPLTKMTDKEQNTATNHENNEIHHF